MTVPDDTRIPRLITPDFLLISEIHKLFQNGYIANVDKIIGDLRAKDFHFSNDRITEIITDLDGIIIQKTGDKKGSTKEYEIIEKEKIDFVRFHQMIAEARDNLLADEKLLAQMTFFGILMMKISSHNSDDEQGFEILLQDLCLMLDVVSRQKKSIKDTGEKSAEFQNMKNQLGVIEDICTRSYRIFSKTYPKMKQQKKQFTDLQSTSLNSEYQKRMLFHLENP